MVGIVGELPASRGVLKRCALIYILQLDATTLVEPILESEDGLVLIHVLFHVVVEEIIRANQIQLGCNGQNASNVCASAGHIVITTFQVFSTQTEMRVLRLVLKTCRPTIALVVLTCNDIVVNRTVNGMSTTNLTCSDNV